jgi:hypothetical protein
MARFGALTYPTAGTRVRGAFASLGFRNPVRQCPMTQMTIAENDLGGFADLGSAVTLTSTPFARREMR